VNIFSTNHTLVDENLTVEPHIRPSNRPLVLDGVSELRPITIVVRVERNANKLGAKELSTNLNLLLLIMQFVMLSEHLRCWFTTTGGNNPDFF
jgi:hypothetical protein